MDYDAPDDPGAVLVATAGLEVPRVLPASLPRFATDAEIAQFVAFRAAACVGADYSNLALIGSADRTMVRLFHGPFLEPAIANRYVDVAVDAPFPITAAIRTGEAIFVAGADEYRAQFPDIWDDTRAAGVEASVSLPLGRSDGSPIGAIGFAWAIAPEFDVKLDRALRAVGHLITEIIERSELYEAEHQMIAELHLRLLSDLPAVGGLATAARYLPAGRSAAVGGDWFEGLMLDEGLFAVVVGDVTGHGLTAAADMALIRGLITSLLDDGVPLEDVFGRVSRILWRRPENVLATAALVVIDPASSTLAYATAGHPPPLLVAPDGTVTRLDLANAPILGVDLSRRVARTVSFASGSRLVMYTDGLVERRDRPFSIGVDEATELLSRGPAALGPNDVIDLLIGSLIGDHSGDDDVAVVVVDHVG